MTIDASSNSQSSKESPTSSKDKSAKSSPPVASTPVGDDDDEEVAVDMEEFEAAGLLDEDDVQTRVTKPDAIADLSGGGGDHGEIVQTRTYDMHITYDKYYQTPRLWLFGYDEVRDYLSLIKSHCSITISETKCMVSYFNGKLMYLINQSLFSFPTEPESAPCRRNVQRCESRPRQEDRYNGKSSSPFRRHCRLRPSLPTCKETIDFEIFNTICLISKNIYNNRYQFFFRLK